MKEEPVGKRFEAIIDHYKLTKNSFSKFIGLSANTLVSRIVNDPDRAPSFAVIKMIAESFPDVSMDWFITGQGPMLKQGPQPAPGQIKYYNASSSRDILGAFSGEVEANSLIQLHGFDDCQYAFDVFGDSMAPRFNPGEIILCREVEGELMVTGESFLVITETQQFIRYLKEVTPKGDFIFSAENTAHKDISINSTQIQTLCIIKGKIRREVY